MDRNLLPIPAPVPRRRVRLALWLGTALFVASVAGVGLRLKLHAGDSSAPTPTSTGWEDCPDCHPVAIGHVDAPGGITSLYPLEPGRLVRIPVKENDLVDPQTPLLQMDDTAAKTTLRQAEAALKIAQTTLAQARLGPGALSDKIAAQEAVIEAKQYQVKAAQDRLTHAEQQLKDTIIPKVEVQAGRQGVKALKAAVQVEEAKLRLLKLQKPQLDIDKATQDVAVKQADVDKARYVLQQCTVKAPVKGRVLRILVHEGETLGPSPRQPAILFAPAGPRIVRAEVEQEFAAHVAVGQTVRINDDSNGKGNWTGRVSHISDWYTNRRSILPEPLQLNDVRTLEAIIELDPNQPHLRIGQRVRVKFGVPAK